MRRIYILIALSLMIASGVVIWGYLNFKTDEQAVSESELVPASFKQGTEDNHKEDGIIKLDEKKIMSAGIVMEDVKKMVINDYVTATGEVKANAEKELFITPRIPGKAVEVKARLGEDVNKGEIIARIDSVETEEMRAGFIGASANLRAAETNLEKEKLLNNNKAKILERVKKGIKSNEAITILKDAEIGKTKADILKPLARLEMGEANLKRERELYQDNISSMKEVVAAEKEYTSAMIEFQSEVEEMFLNAKNELARAEAEYMSSKARMEERREHFYHYGFSDVEIDKMVEDSEREGHVTVPVVSPFKGRVVERTVAIGELVDTSTKLFKIVDLSTVWVWANVYEKDLGKVKIGQTVYITVTPYPDRVFTGRITYISDTIDPSTRIVKVRAELENPERLLKPEMFASVKIEVGQAISLAVPESAVQREGKNTIVFVANPTSPPFDKGGQGGIFEKRDVTLGTEADGYYQVISGLKEGERLVTNGAFTLKSESLKGLMEEE